MLFFYSRKKPVNQRISIVTSAHQYYDNTFTLWRNVIMGKHRSIAVAILFALFLGPIGLLYGSFWGAVVISILMFVLLLLPMANMAQYLFSFLWLLCPYISVYKILQYNRKHPHHHHSYHPHHRPRHNQSAHPEKP
ncbi:MAG: hypothetical protein A3C55_03735 [Gammaproteobacteria bacterium RIFCSPHIGHO2_02_FULL_42_13]|nr:MAG: hypothetical protein A3C55_03735 [Gammaproteobacteria bacterium RIFCSPHIGHO2_02_FULL_42_13]OGT70223.1 MAG: hypothetical protein A3H43_05965 [Gammaproteobacteria bacterium RIFCSPLOWO2_02_FULL_42_9]